MKTERWQVQCEKMKHEIYERLKRCSEESNKIGEGWKAEGDDVKKEEDGEERTEMVVLTPNGTVLTGMPVGPPLSPVRMFFWISRTHSCLFCYPLRVLPYRARRPQCKQEHIHTPRHTHTNTLEQARVGGERAERVGRPRGRGAQGFISGGMLLVSRDAHFICSQKQMGATSLILLAPEIFPSTSFYPRALPSHSLSTSFFPLYSTPSPIVSTFQLWYHPETHSHPNLIPPFCCPSLPTRHAHLCLLYVLWQRDNLFFQGLDHTRIAGTVENGCWFFFFQSGSVSVCEVTYSDKALGWEGGGLLPTPRDNGPDAQSGGGAEGPAPQKALVLLIKRPSFAARKRPPFLYLSPPLSLSWLNAGKSTSLPKPRREINARRRGEEWGRRRETTGHYSVPLDRDLVKNITWDFSPVHGIKFGQWRALQWQRMWDRRLETLMSMKIGLIILLSLWHKPALVQPAEQSSAEELIDKNFFRSHRKWRRLHQQETCWHSWRLQVVRASGVWMWVRDRRLVAGIKCYGCPRVLLLVVYCPVLKSQRSQTKAEKVGGGINTEVCSRLSFFSLSDTIGPWLAPALMQSKHT